MTTPQSKYVDYKIVQANSASILEEKVNELLKEGYEPLGSPIPIASMSSYHAYAQALVLKR